MISTDTSEKLRRFSTGLHPQKEKYRPIITVTCAVDPHAVETRI
jgi:hypothetical protein